MAKINNSAVMQKLIDELELYPAKDTIPSELAEKILPVFQVNSEQLTITTTPSNVVASQVLNGAGPATIYTTPATEKFYLTNVCLSARCGSAVTTGNENTSVSVTINGAAVKIAGIIFKVIAAGIEQEGGDVVLNLQNPILIDASTNITMESDNGGNGSIASIVGYTE